MKTELPENARGAAGAVRDRGPGEAGAAIVRRVFAAVTAVLSIAWLLSATVAEAADGTGVHRLGVGANYWKTLDDLDQPYDENGFSYLVSYQYAPAGLFKFEAAVEYFQDLAWASDAVWAPEAFVIIGSTIYAGAGVGVYYSGGDWGEEPFYMLRAGFDFPVLPNIFLDINANYRFNDWGSLSGSDLNNDTIRLGAAVRFAM